MKLYSKYIFFVSVLILCHSVNARDIDSLAPARKGTLWVQPAAEFPAKPVWGHSNGIQVELSSHPRGLLRIYTPYLGQNAGTVMNFIAFEPIAKGDTERGYSELEMSKLDNQRGKRFWSANDTLGLEPVSMYSPVSGIVEKVNAVETLTVYIFSETFENGAKVYTRLRFYENKPYEVELATYAAAESEVLDYFILSATMGNYARLRNLHLKSGIVTPSEIWPNHTGDGFTSRASFSAGDFVIAKNGNAYFIADPNERNPEKTGYSSDTESHWKYHGKKATQYWYKTNREDLKGVVTARYTYWASQSPIPGGTSYENVELNSPFKQGDVFVFGITPLPAHQFIKNINGKL